MFLSFTDPLDVAAESKKSRRKKCPDCLTIFDTHFELFNHQIEECKRRRDISIVRIEKASQPQAPPKPKRKPIPAVLLGQNPTATCTDCNETFPTFHALNQHKRFVCTKNPFRRPPKPKKYYRCRCGTQFSNPSNLKRHKTSGTCAKVMKNNYSAKMFYCVECKSEYSTMSNLRRHKQTQCPFGPKLTILPTMHEQRVACPDCGVTFSRRNNLARHRKMVKCTEWRDAPSQNDDYDESDETEE